MSPSYNAEDGDRLVNGVVIDDGAIKEREKLWDSGARQIGSHKLGCESAEGRSPDDLGDANDPSLLAEKAGLLDGLQRSSAKDDKGRDETVRSDDFGACCGWYPFLGVLAASLVRAKLVAEGGMYDRTAKGGRKSIFINNLMTDDARNQRRNAAKYDWFDSNAPVGGMLAEDSLSLLGIDSPPCNLDLSVDTPEKLDGAVCGRRPTIARAPA
ncbi:hypothetical protein DFH06DRAFT_1320199 [Mycena polygramma]|nr:hypothetical protein DFH06DRAFT_1320199 [Mycena polygramma]